MSKKVQNCIIPLPSLQTWAGSKIDQIFHIYNGASERNGRIVDAKPQSRARKGGQPHFINTMWLIELKSRSPLFVKNIRSKKIRFRKGGQSHLINTMWLIE